MPARRKPDDMKLLHGTWRPDRAAPDHVQLPLVEGMPLPPAWLTNVYGLEEWQRLVPILVANRLLTHASLATFAHFCALHGALVQLTIAGTVPQASLLAQYRALANDFALTYAGQQKLPPPAPLAAGRTNPFAEFAKDRA
jgi:hypothetical protein